MTGQNRKTKLLAFLPLCTASILSFASNLLCYYIPKVVVPESRYIHYYGAVDRIIPFCPFFITFYIVSYVQWCNYYLRASISEKRVKFTYLTAEVLSKIICLVCFIAIPLTIDRPQFEVTGIFTFLTSFIYLVDTPFCLFPSIHCIQSYLSLRLALQSNRKDQRWLSVLTFIFTIGVFLSTMMVKQHLFCDVISGIILPEICIQAIKHTQLPDYFDKLTDKVNKLIYKS